MSERFHRAAKDGYLPVLKETTKRDCNHPDEDGMTPTACAAYEGQLDALRLLVGRGGDPDKCDYFGNTSLHWAAAKGHMHCVSFLINFGVNIWALDHEFHSAKDLAAINDREEILKYLDSEAAKQEKEDLKKARRLQEKAKKDAEKRQKECDKMQRKADEKRHEEEEKIQKEREKINNLENTSKGSQKKGFLNSISKNSFSIMSSNKYSEPKIIHSKSVQSSATKFSELTQNSNANKKSTGGIQLKLLKKKINEENSSVIAFKVREIETDGKKSVRNLSGLQRDSEIIFVPNGSMSSTENESSSGKRGKITDVFGSESSARAKSEPDFGESLISQNQNASLFVRPAFGSIAFRKSLATTLGNIESNNASRTSGKLDDNDDSTDSHGSPKSRNLATWTEEDMLSDGEEESPLFLFLTANGLGKYLPIFTKKRIDLDAMMLLIDQDLEAMNIPPGPRRKLMRALNDRRMTFEDPGEVFEIRL